MNASDKFINIAVICCTLFSPVSTLANENNNIILNKDILTNYISNKNIYISKTMSKLELINYVAKNNNITKYEAEKILFKNYIDNNYSYKVIHKYINPNLKIEIYTAVKETDNSYSINKILTAQVKHEKYFFSGNFYINLEDNNNIYYDIEGELVEQYTESFANEGNYSGKNNYGTINFEPKNNSKSFGHISESNRFYLY